MTEKKVPTSIGSNSTPEEVQAFLEHTGMTPGDLQRAFSNMFGGKLRGQKVPIPGLEEMKIEKTPYDEAMDLVNDAFEATLSLEKRRSLLNKAIKICPDCADAYLALGTMADFPDETLRFFQEAVAAGERYAGKDSFENEVGHFWKIAETRPYMQSRKMLGDCLWIEGKREEAISHYQDMLRLNPNDNQGIRHILIGWLIETGRNQEAKTLLDQYPGDDFAAWPYSEALLAFRESGDDKTSRVLLKKAKKENPFVFEYLSAPARIPEDLPEHYALGSEEEALIYLSEHLPVWENTPGALEWVHQQWFGKSRATKSNDPKKDERTQALLEMLQRFCREHLDDDYEYLCTKLVMKLSRKRQVVYTSGKLESWAAAVVCTIGSMNFLYDKSFEPYMRQEDIAKAFGVSSSNVSAKTTQIRDLCDLHSPVFFNDEFSTKRMKEENPLNKLMVSPGGLLFSK